MNNITKSMLFSKIKHKVSHLNIITTNKHFQNYYSFSKKQELKKKKYQYDPSKIKPKSQEDYINLPDNLKKNVVQVRHMLTATEANIQSQTLKIITIDQRKLLQRSLKEQIQKQLKPIEAKQNQTRISKLINKYMVAEQLNKYYILRPLKYLQNLYFNLFLGNILGMGWFQFINDYNSIGWFFGYFTSPAAASALAILIGYNFSFWIVRQIFHVHLPLNQIQSKDISLISTTWRNLFEIGFIACNFSVLMYSLSFGFAIPLYKTYILLAFINFMHLGLNLYEILKSTSSFHKIYLIDFMRILSVMTLLILLFGIYSVQIASSKKIEESVDSAEYRARILAIGRGNNEFLNYFKHKKYQMKEDQKINPQDAD